MKGCSGNVGRENLSWQSGIDMSRPVEESLGSRAEDEPFPGGRRSLPSASPNHLSVFAYLLGLEPAPVEQSRILEIHCGSGMHLLPLAEQWPNSRFTGIDPHPARVAEAQAAAEALGLRNIEFLNLTPENWDQWKGQVDYLIARRVFSWVAGPARTGLLALAGRVLAPEGIASISYNTDPGWHLRRMARELAQQQQAGRSDPREQLARTRAFLNDLRERLPNPGGAYEHAIRAEAEKLAAQEDDEAYQDLLGEICVPILFQEFLEQIEPHGLQYLTESVFVDPLAEAVRPAVRQTLRQTRGPLDYEQEFDFLFGRDVRHSLLIRARPAIRREPDPKRVGDLWIVCPAVPQQSLLVARDDKPLEFAFPNGTRLTLTWPWAKAALVLLGQSYPRPVHTSEIFDMLPLVDFCSTPMELPSALELHRFLLGLFGMNVAQLQTWPWTTDHRRGFGDRPQVRPVARYQAARGWPMTNHLHEPVRLRDPLAGRLIGLLDGTRDLPTLVAALLPDFRAATDFAPQGGFASEAEFQQRVAAQLHEALLGLARLPLLVR